MAMCADKQELFSSFYIVEEHLNGIRKMIGEDQPCLDVLRRMYDARKAIEQLEVVLLDHHLAACLREGFRSEMEEALIAELVQLYLLVGNR
jgi:DNA-binding FrmR family transcriptional regulator